MQILRKTFTENSEKFGQIERVYITNSSSNDDETYIGFMSMVDTKTHQAIVDNYDGKRLDKGSLFDLNHLKFD